MTIAIGTARLVPILLAGTVLMHTVPACSSDVPIAPIQAPEGPPTVEFVLREHLITDYRPHGVAVSDDGSRVVVASYGERQVTILDGVKYLPIAEPIRMPNNWGVEIVPDGRLAVVAARYGAWGLDLVNADYAFSTDIHSSRVVGNREGTSFYTAGYIGSERLGAVVRFDADGRIAATHRTDNGYHKCLDLSIDGNDLLTVDTRTYDLLVLDPITLENRTRIPIGTRTCIPVPLDQPGFVLLVGGGLDGPLSFTKVNYRDRMIENQQFVDLRRGVAQPTFGRGNPWARIGTGHIVFPTNFGFLMFDSFSGEFLGMLEDVPGPTFSTLCCEAAYDGTRNRLIVVGNVNQRGSAPAGRLLVYDIVQDGFSPPN